MVRRQGLTKDFYSFTEVSLRLGVLVLLRSIWASDESRYPCICVLTFARLETDREGLACEFLGVVGPTLSHPYPRQ